ncbi:MAG: protein phosphatase 2C domain-containing protein [Lachnospiraceae bacterium]|nr:protein phosphatase 2C domain-containing protein [Lachnospiraceae bacterium]
MYDNKENICFVHKGANRDKCKDVYFYKKSKYVRVIGLCDGVSTQKFSDIGAYEVQKSISDMLDEIEDFSEINEIDLKFKIGCVINETIFELSKKYDCEEESFASTLMLAILPEGKDFYWTVHIGDGVIGLVDNNYEVRILSNPENGITRQYTYTTVSGNFMKRLRVKRHDERGFIFLMTDGISNEIEDNQSYLDYVKGMDWKGLENDLLSKNISDDIGFNGIMI